MKKQIDLPIFERSISISVRGRGETLYLGILSTVRNTRKTLNDYDLPPLAKIMIENGGLDF